MSRAERLLKLMEHLRQHRYPVRGNELAEALNISVRTLYRDIASLQAQGARIEGEPGIGYLLKPGFTLPPMMFSEEEIEALVLGARFVAQRADTDLSLAARNLISKISAVLPENLRHDLQTSGLLVAPHASLEAEDESLRVFREAIRKEEKLCIHYLDQQGKASTRTIWPFALGFFEEFKLISAWCELRQEIRHFRLDRVKKVETPGLRYPRRRQALLKEWHLKNGIPEQ